MGVLKTCSRPGCADRGVAQIVYTYDSSQVKVIPVEENPPTGAYILCQAHLDRFTVPKGWTLIRAGTQAGSSLTSAEIDSLAEEIRRVGLGIEPEGTEHSLSSRANLVMLSSRAHLRVVADASSMSAGARN